MHAQDVRQAITGMAAHAEPLMLGLPDGIKGDGSSMLPGLVTVEAMIEVLKSARTALLCHERRIGTSWGELQAATGTHASTWRFRHGQAVNRA